MQVLRSLVSKLAGLAQPVLRAAAPHAQKVLEAAIPHITDAATTAVKNTTDRAAAAISKRIAAVQEGHGVAKKRRASKKPYSVKRIRRIPPRNLPDFF